LPYFALTKKENKVQRTNSITVFVFLALICLVLSPSIGSAEIILTTANGSGADTFLSNDTQTGNYGATSIHGGDKEMQARISDGSRMKMPYFRFDISSASGLDLTGAYVTLIESYGNRARTWNVYGLNDSTEDVWNEAATSYSNAPGILQPANGGVAYNSALYSFDPAKVTLLTTIALASSAPATVSSAVNTAMDSFLAADTNGMVTFMIVAQASDSAPSYGFATKENTGSYAYPTLTLPKAVPEPATLSMLAAVGLLALCYFRRSYV
jgi:hypothetical protein